MHAASVTQLKEPIGNGNMQAAKEMEICKQRDASCETRLKIWD